MSPKRKDFHVKDQMSDEHLCKDSPKIEKLLSECQNVFFELVFSETEANAIESSELTQFTNLSYIQHVQILNIILTAQAQFHCIRTVSKDAVWVDSFSKKFDASLWIQDLSKHLHKMKIDITEDLFACLYFLFHEYTQPLQENTNGFQIVPTSFDENNAIQIAEDRLRPAILLLLQSHSMDVVFPFQQENQDVKYLTDILVECSKVPAEIAVLSVLYIFQKCSQEEISSKIENLKETFPKKLDMALILPWYLFTDFETFQNFRKKT